jgi:hypothetical protein
MVGAERCVEKDALNKFDKPSFNAKLIPMPYGRTNFNIQEDVYEVQFA